MQFTITINQAKALEWGLNAQQALLFAFVYSAPSWASPVEQNGATFYALSKAKIAEELPLLTDKADTAYRMLKALAAADLIVLSSTSSITLVRLTEKALDWNRKHDGSEKYPTPKEAGKVGKKSDLPRKKIRSTSEKNPGNIGKKSEPGSEKNPTNQDTSNQDTSNQDTNQDTSHTLQLASPRLPANAKSEPVKSQAEQSRQEACRSIWSAYSVAYESRYGIQPVRNAKVNTQVNDLLKRLGAEAAAVAAYYVLINDAYLIRSYHEFGQLLAKAEAYRTAWATQTQVTGRTAQQAEKTQANLSAAQAALQVQRERRAASANA